MKSSSLMKLSTLGLSSEQMAVVRAVRAEELAPLEERREKDRLRKAGGKSAAPPRIIGGISAENPRIAPALDYKPILQTVDNSRITPLNPPSTQNPPAQLIHVEQIQFPDGFEVFWDAYPSRAGGKDKPGAVKAYRAAIKRAKPEQIAAGASRYRDYCAASGKLKTEFVLQARTWLNRNGWDEDYEQSNQPRGYRSNIASILRD